jgi:hypothetical protein
MNHSNLGVVVVVMTMMTGVGVGRNNRTSQNDQCDSGEKHCTQFHKRAPFQADTLANGL